jgi:hypothetical protein
LVWEDVEQKDEDGVEKVAAECPAFFPTDHDG